MQVSVIIPTYNRCHTLGRAIDSVMLQQSNATEVIVVDDGSTDETENLLITRYPLVRYIKLQNNQGVSHARNAAIQATDCEWLAFLDSDDEWLPEKLTRQSECLETNPDYRICHSDEIWIRNGRRVNSMHKHAKHGGDIFLHCLPRCVISPSSIIIHRSVFADVGLFDEGLPVCEDYDLWLRVCARFPVLYVHEKLLIKYGGHEDQLSTRHWGMDRFRVQALENILQSSLDKLHGIAVLETLIEKLAIILNGAEKRNNAELHNTYSEKLPMYQELLSQSVTNEHVFADGIMQ